MIGFKRESKPFILPEPQTRRGKGERRLKDRPNDEDLPPPSPPSFQQGTEANLSKVPSAASELPTSFTTISSSESSKIFTPSPGNGETSSNATSFYSQPLEKESEDEYHATQGTTEALWSFHEETDVMDTRATPQPAQSRNDGLEPLVSGLGFKLQYELFRVSEDTAIPVTELAKCVDEQDTYRDIWKKWQALTEWPSYAAPKMSSREAWRCANNEFRGPSKELSVVLSGTLEWASGRESDAFRIHLSPLKIAEGCRFHRKYGADRFLTLRIPTPPREVFRRHGIKGSSFQEAVVEWLAGTEHEIAGRAWRAFWVDTAQRNIRRRNRSIYDEEESLKKEKVLEYRVVLFAVRSCAPSSSELADTTIQDFIAWHIPINANIRSTDLKTYQRLKLGLSQTVPSAVIERLEFANPGDKISSMHKVMNDGCARISRSLAEAIAKSLGVNSPPSVFQARIGGAKGLWMVECDETMRTTYPEQMSYRNFCIEVTPSQLKIKPHPCDRIGADEHQRTFEIVDHSVPTRAASLNEQITSILHDRGVPPAVLREMLLLDSATYHEGLFRAMNQTLSLREWIGSNKQAPRTAESIPSHGSIPRARDEQAIILLESGFTQDDCPMLVSRVKDFLKDKLEGYVAKMQIRVPLSTYMYCIADPLGVLEEGEVHVGFSETWTDPGTGFSNNMLHELDVLVGRLPAHLPSDVQRLRAVFKLELSNYKDVMIFPTKGTTSVAELLSGGDYDGDMPLLIWDARIVDHFRNAKIPDMRPSEAECGLEQKWTKLSNIFSSRASIPMASEITTFLYKCFEFNLHQSKLGFCTTEHEMVAYQDRSLASFGAVKLATLAGYLVDSAKQGYMLSDAAWAKFKGEVNPKPLGKPAYKQTDLSCRPKEIAHVMDYLKFDVAIPEMNRTIAKFHQVWPVKISNETEEALKAPMSNLHMHAIRSEALRDVIRDLQKDVKRIKQEWGRLMSPAKSETSESMKREVKELSFGQAVATLHQSFCAIKPRQCEHELSNHWAAEKDKPLSHWNILRASCLYAHKTGPEDVCPWYLGGTELCHIMVSQAGPSRTVKFDIYNSYRVDPKFVKRVFAREEDDAEDVLF